jgi:D-amino-acid dehydrogenase
MRVMVLGAGVIGTSCAYYLAKAGHEVTVVERCSGPALETSFANAGGICPGFAGPWAAPGIPRKLARWLFAPHAPVVLRPQLDPQQWRWLARFLRNCGAERFARNKTRMQRIAHYSKACLAELRAETGIAFDHNTGGVLQLFRTEDELAAAQRSARVLTEFGIAHRIVDVQEILALEPALGAAAAKLMGGLHLPADETGDCRKFTVALAELVQRRGVIFKFETTITRLLRDGLRIAGVSTDHGELDADAYVIALGSAAARMLQPLGIDLPIYPVKGYSITIDIGESVLAPRSAVMDEHYKVLITRLGTRLRAAGVAEIAGYDLSIPSSGPATVLRSLRELFPDPANAAAAAGPAATACNAWAGLRPMTPDGPPYLGATGFTNLFVNVGHGSNGWTQACGCGRVVADVLSGRRPEIDLEGYGIGR